jgi:hypothetical protein
MELLTGHDLWWLSQVRRSILVRLALTKWSIALFELSFKSGLIFELEGCLSEEGFLFLGYILILSERAKLMNLLGRWEFLRSSGGGSKLGESSWLYSSCHNRRESIKWGAFLASLENWLVLLDWRGRLLSKIYNLLIGRFLKDSHNVRKWNLEFKW